MSKHPTYPTPWRTTYKFNRSRASTLRILDADDIIVATLPRNDSQARQEITGALLTAAPNLLAAAKDFYFVMPLPESICHHGLCKQSECGNCNRIKAIIDAIEAAEDYHDDWKQ